MVFLYGYYECERYIVDKIFLMLKEYDDIVDIDEKILMFEERNGIVFLLNQKKVIKMVLI